MEKEKFIALKYKNRLLTPAFDGKEFEFLADVTREVRKHCEEHPNDEFVVVTDSDKLVFTLDKKTADKLAGLESVLMQIKEDMQSGKLNIGSIISGKIGGSAPKNSEYDEDDY